jgi:hypothetical protein
MDGRYVVKESELCEDGQMLYRLCRILSPVGWCEGGVVCGEGETRALWITGTAGLGPSRCAPVGSGGMGMRIYLQVCRITPVVV